MRFVRDENGVMRAELEPAERVAHLMDCAYMSIESFVRKREGRERLPCNCGMAEKYGQPPA